LTRQLHAAEVVGRLGVPELSSGRLARELQQHVVMVPPKARGDQFAVLEALDLYHEDSGLWWENAEYLALEAAII
jgi:CRISPR-associated endonuclease/helicase Cas3